MGIVATNVDRRRAMVAWSGWILALVAPLGLTALLNLVGGPKSREYAFLYLGLVAIIAVTFGLWPSLASAMVSFALIDYFFVPPFHTFTIADEQDIVNLVVLLGAAGLVGSLGSLRRSAQIRSEALSRRLQVANKDLERLNREQAQSAQVALRLAVTEQQVQALEESDTARRDFLANVSHDLRTPIATILTGSTAVLEDPNVSSQARSTLESVAAEARRLNAVVADMLDMARIEGSALDLQLEPVDLNLALGSANDRLHRVSPDRAVTLPASDPGFLLLADWGRLGQVLDNLLSNADRAAPAGTPLSVEFSADRQRGLGTVRVRDQGPGIPQELGERVFERFVRGEGGGGTGLGLAIVKGLVEAQAGRVWIDPPGEGASIAFSLPLADLAGSDEERLAGDRSV
jgi:two-component system, OmpR family, sensor histidine kinase KdpD